MADNSQCSAKAADNSQCSAKAAEAFKDGGKWTIILSNYEAALEQLLVAQPKVAIVWSTSKNPLPEKAISSLAQLLKDCDVKIKFSDSFEAPQNTSTDSERMNSFLANSSLRIREFCGHLGPADFARLPEDIEELALAIHNAADAVTLSKIKMKDSALCVSVSRAVSIKDIKPLVLGKFGPELYFSGVDDEELSNTIMGLRALMGGERDCEHDYSLHLPNCRLTTDAAFDMSRHLTCQDWQLWDVCIECTADSTITDPEKSRIGNALGRVRGCDSSRVKWEMIFWPYE